MSTADDLTTQMPAQVTPQAGHAGYLAVFHKRRLICIALFIGLIVTVLADIATGPARYGLGDVAQAILRPYAAEDQLRVIVWTIRMPAALMAVLAGIALSVAGVQMQTILNNPLASPFTLGLSAGAGFGASLALAFGVALVPWAGQSLVAVNAFVMAMVAAMIIHIASMRRGASVQTIILLGIALVFAFNTALSLVQYFARQEAVSAIVFWTMGSLSKATWPKVAVTAAALIIALPIFAAKAWQLTALRLGEAQATAFGISVGRLRLTILIPVALLTAIPVAFVGTIGFVGLVGPHIARMLVGEDQRLLMPTSALVGALILSGSSIIAKVVMPGAVLPIGIVTSAVGLPVFLVLILRSEREIW